MGGTPILARALGVALTIATLTLALRCHVAQARSFTSSASAQQNVLVTVDAILVDAGLRRERDGGRPWCQLEPQLYYLLRRVVVGNPRRHVDLVISTRSPFLLLPDDAASTSQTLRTPTVTPEACDSGVLGAETLYVGSGMTTHSAVVIGPLPSTSALPLPLTPPGAGSFGMGLDAKADTSTESRSIHDTRGVWARKGQPRGLGWANASMFFGDAETRGWIMFNSTDAHPYSYADRASVSLLATPDAGSGFVLHAPGSITIAGSTWERQVVLLPESPFIELPEDIFDAAIMPLGANVHAEGVEETAWFTALDGSVAVTFAGMRFPMEARAIVVDHIAGDVGDVAKYLVFRRAAPGSHAVRIGCAPFRMNVFLDATSVDNDTSAGVSLRLARVEHVADTHPLNVIMFSILVMLFLVYMLGASLTANVMSRDIEIPTHSLLAELHHGWSMEVVEICGALCSTGVILANAAYLDLVPRYAFLMDSDLGTAQSFVRSACWTVSVLGGLHVVVVILELVAVRMDTRGHRAPRWRKGRAARPSKASALLSVAVAPLATLDNQGPIGADELVMGTLRMWNLHLILRRICGQSCMLLGIAVSVMEGPREGYNTRILATVVVAAFVVPCHMFASLARAVWIDISMGGRGARCAMRLQVAVYTVTTLAFMIFVVAYLMEPLSTMVFPVFPTTVLWTISALLALLFLCIGILGQLDLSRKSQTTHDPIDTLVL